MLRDLGCRPILRDGRGRHPKVHGLLLVPERYEGLNSDSLHDLFPRTLTLLPEAFFCAFVIVVLFKKEGNSQVRIFCC